MATFTSVTSGNWNDGATWGLTSPGVKGTDWPGIAGDIVNIGTTAGQAHVVTYNVSETNELGVVTIGATSGSGYSRLNFSVGMNTKLTMSHNELAVRATGELRIGSSGAVIPKQYLAELIWNTTADNAKGITVAIGGKVTVYDDPDYYGSNFRSVLYQDFTSVAQGTTGVTLLIEGDFSAKWASGHELLVHFGQAYGYATTDAVKSFMLFTLTAAPTWDGNKTTLTGTVTGYTGTVGTTFKAGGDVANLSRNVIISKLNAAKIPGQYNTNRPRMSNASAAGTIYTSNLRLGGAWIGCYGGFAGYGLVTEGVFRNGYHLGYNIYGATINGIIAMMGGSYSIQSAYGCSIGALCMSWATYGISGANNLISGDLFGIGSIVLICNTFTLTGNVYSCSMGAQGLKSVISGQVGYDGSNRQKANVADYAGGNWLYYSDITVLNSKSISPTMNYRNTPPYMGRVKFEHLGQVTGAHYIMDFYGDILKIAADGTGDNPSQRTGGNVDAIEVVPQSLCSIPNYLEILNVRLWAAAGVSKTYRFYVQTDFAALLTTALKLYGDYLDQGSGGHLATVSSTQNIATRANAADWSQYVEVTINPAQTGYVNLYLRLMGYEASKKVWVDPKPEGVAMTPRWSCGEVVLEPITASGGGSVSPTNLGLVPLGVKQVAI